MSLWSKKLLTGIFFLWPFIWMQGCGYTLNHRLKGTFVTEKGIFVPVFTNKTDETGAEIIFTDAFIRELQSHGEKVTNHGSDSGLEINGTVTDITFQVVVFTKTGYEGTHGLQYTGHTLQSYARMPDQVSVNVTVALNAVDPKTKESKWSKAFTASRIVNSPLDRVSNQDAPSSVGMIAQSNYESSYPEIARDIMRDVYDQMLDM